jgi:DNA-binding NarL/FixJ family response regulator
MIPQAQLVLLDDDGDLYGYPRDSHQLLAAIDGFVRSLEIDTTATSQDTLVREHVAMHPLTPRELEVLRLLASGDANAEIARLVISATRLVISERTVARHITNIYGKIDARSKVDAAAYAIRHQLT